MTRQKWLQFDWEVLIHPPYFPDIAASDFLFFFFSFCGLYKILLMEKMSVPWNTIKSTWNGILFKKIKHLGKMELWIAWKMAEGSGTKQYVVQLSYWWKWKVCLLFLLRNGRKFLTIPVPLALLRKFQDCNNIHY